MFVSARVFPSQAFAMRIAARRPRQSWKVIVSFDLVISGPNGGCPTLAAPIGELRKSQTALSELIRRLFADLDDRRRQLDAQARDLRMQRDLLVENQSAGNALLSQGPTYAEHQEQLSALDAELQSTRYELARVREQADATAGSLTIVSANRDELAAQLAETLSNLERARAQVEELAQSAQQFAAAREQLEQLRTELQVARSEAARSGSDAVVHHQQQLCELELERRVLKAELEAVRRHATDLADHLSESRRQFVEERAEWNAELGHLRRLLERQSQMAENRGNLGLYAGAGQRGAANLDLLDKNHDPVLGAVMAQFAQIQYELHHDRQPRGERLSSRPPLEDNEG
jgi:hypothetical protein